MKTQINEMNKNPRINPCFKSFLKNLFIDYFILESPCLSIDKFMTYFIIFTKKMQTLNRQTDYYDRLL